MAIQAHLLSALDALKTVQTAMSEAIELLPEDIKKQHWVAQKHSPSPWTSVKFWYDAQPDHDAVIADVIVDLESLAICKEQLIAMPIRKRGSVEVPKLAKVRRTA